MMAGKQILFPIFFYLIFNVLPIFSEPTPDTIVTLTTGNASLQASYEVLENSEFLKVMFSHDMLESNMLAQGEGVSLDVIFEDIYERLWQIRVIDFFSPQDLLLAIVGYLKLIHKKKL